METAAKILIVGGVLNLAVAFAAGYLLSNKRLTPPHEGPYYLLQAHRGALQEGFMLLGLAWAVQLSRLPEGIEIAAAWLLVAASALQDGGSLLAYAMGTEDEFRERSPSFYVVTANAILATIGIAIVLFGVLTSL